MDTATFTKDSSTIKVNAINDAGMGFISNLVCRGWYTEEEAYDLCHEYEDKYVRIQYKVYNSNGEQVWATIPH